MSEKAIRDKNEDDPIGAFKQSREMDPEWNAKLDAELALQEYHERIAPPNRAPGLTPKFARVFLEELDRQLTDPPPPRFLLEDVPVERRDGTPEQAAAWRKARPVYSGVLKYFPDALLAVAHCSKVGNDQHNPGEPLHWAREKSTDEEDALIRHVLDRSRGEVYDGDGVRHLAKAAWRALAALQKEIERDGGDL